MNFGIKLLITGGLLGASIYYGREISNELHLLKKESKKTKEECEKINLEKEEYKKKAHILCDSWIQNNKNHINESEDLMKKNEEYKEIIEKYNSKPAIQKVRELEEEIENDIGCDICTEEFDKTQHKKMNLLCGHSLCSNCLDIWIQTEGNEGCPFCRREVQGADVDDAFYEEKKDIHQRLRSLTKKTKKRKREDDDGDDERKRKRVKLDKFYSEENGLFKCLICKSKKTWKTEDGIKGHWVKKHCQFKFN